MHISDGVLSPAVIAAGWVITILLLLATLWWSKKDSDISEDIPKISVMTGAFFVASLIHVSIGPTSIHLVLNGLLGVVLGTLAYPAIFIGLVLQALLFQHGGITSIGINVINMGIPALIVYWIFKKGYSAGISPSILGIISGSMAALLSAVMLAIVLISTGDEFTEVAYAAAAANVPIMVIEGILTGSVVTFLLKVRPELLPIKKEK